MLVEIRAKNCFVFENQIVFSLNADMRNKKFGFNVHKENDFNVLKTAGIYGPNNAGKSCLVRCIRVIKQIFLNEKKSMMTNIFSQNSICELGITFISLGKEYSYDFKYDTEKSEFLYERFAEISKDQYNNEKQKVWLEKDCINKKYQCDDEEVVKMMPLMGRNNLLCYLIDTTQFECLDKIKHLIVELANKIDVINMNNIPMKHTIELMKNKNNLQERVVDFIKNADLYLDDFKFVDLDKIHIETDDENKSEEDVLNIPKTLMDQIRLVSTYKGISVPSMLFDSTGTKKIAALASYVIEALDQGRILVVDELDSSIHFKLTRAIVALFNNELNTDAQMIFTVHDINLMDCKKLFRKEQIWFIYKDENDVYLYSLADFTARQGVRDTTDIIEKYKKGVLGALPDPDLIHSLLDIKNKRKEVDVDE